MLLLLSKLPKLPEWLKLSRLPKLPDAAQIKEKVQVNKLKQRLPKWPETGGDDHKPWIKWLCIGLCVVLLSAGAAFALTGGGSWDNVSEANRQQNVYVKVKPGMDAGTIGELLQHHGIIHSKYKFWLMAKLNGYDSKFRTGSYAFRHDMDPREVLQILVSGTTSTIKFTIPEGYTIREIAGRLADEGVVEKDVFLKAAKDFAPYSYIKKDKRAEFYAEGFLFPDTYEISSDAAAEDILKMMSRNFDQRLTAQMREEAADKGLSVYELITLASLVEKEARFAEDRPIIAQVFLKRLRIGMPLQSDTTLQYLLDEPKEDVSIQDTKMESPYNTYQNKGLPPGPIANPGTASIEAVLHPADTDYLYFVADRHGRNHYSMSYDEHLDIVSQVR